jgi:hypothetical protein
VIRLQGVAVLLEGDHLITVIHKPLHYQLYARLFLEQERRLLIRAKEPATSAQLFVRGVPRNYGTIIVEDANDDCKSPINSDRRY